MRAVLSRIVMSSLTIFCIATSLVTVAGLKNDVSTSSKSSSEVVSSGTPSKVESTLRVAPIWNWVGGVSGGGSVSKGQGGWGGGGWGGGGWGGNQGGPGWNWNYGWNSQKLECVPPSGTCKTDADCCQFRSTPANTGWAPSAGGWGATSNERNVICENLYDGISALKTCCVPIGYRGCGTRAELCCGGRDNIHTGTSTSDDYEDFTEGDVYCYDDQCFSYYRSDLARNGTVSAE